MKRNLTQTRIVAGFALTLALWSADASGVSISVARRVFPSDSPSQQSVVAAQPLPTQPQPIRPLPDRFAPNPADPLPLHPLPAQPLPIGPLARLR